MKTGCLGLYLPSPQTILHDMKQIFIGCQKRIAKIRQVGLFAMGPIHVPLNKQHAFPGS
jgi:hypothetical protein